MNRISVLLLLFVSTVSVSLGAKKASFEMKYYAVVYNGDTVKMATGKQLKGVVKKHTKRLPVGELANGDFLYVEVWLSREGVNQSKMYVVQHRYFAKNSEGKWRQICVSRRFKFNGNHLENAKYQYSDPQSGETLAVLYRLSVVDRVNKKP